MAHPLPPHLIPSEVAFLCEMEHVTVIPRQRLDSLDLLGGPTKPLVPPFPTTLPLWLALLLKRQKRANINPPPWLDPSNLASILDVETDDRTASALAPQPDLPPATTYHDPALPYLHPPDLEPSAPFLTNAATASAQQDALPYHWLELAHLLLTHAADDFDDADTVRRLVRDLREVRMSKLRKGFKVLEGAGGVQMNGVGGMEVAEVRGFVSGMMDGLRKVGRTREEARRDGAGQDEGMSEGGDRGSDDMDF